MTPEQISHVAQSLVLGGAYFMLCILTSVVLWTIAKRVQ